MRAHLLLQAGGPGFGEDAFAGFESFQHSGRNLTFIEARDSGHLTYRFESGASPVNYGEPGGHPVLDGNGGAGLVQDGIRGGFFRDDQEGFGHR